MRHPHSYVILPLSAPVASGTRFWTLPGSVLRAFWPSRWLKPLLEFLLERSRAAQEHFFPALEASKSSPRALQDASRLPRGLQELSKSSPRGFRIDFGAILEAFGEPFWSYLRKIWGQLWESLFVAIEPQRISNTGDSASSGARRALERAA